MGGVDGRMLIVMRIRPTAGENSKTPTHLYVYVISGGDSKLDILVFKCKSFASYHILHIVFSLQVVPQSFVFRNRPRLPNRHLHVNLQTTSYQRTCDVMT